MIHTQLRTTLITSSLLAIAAITGVVFAWRAELAPMRSLALACGVSIGLIAVSTAIQAALIQFTHRAASLPPTHITRRIWSTLTFTTALTCLVPLGWLAHEHEQLVDLSAMRQIAPGASTRDATERLSGTLRITAFLPPTSDLVPVLSAYFTPLDAVEFTAIDQRSHPDEARRLSIRDNGSLVIEYTPTPGASPAIKRLDIGLSRQQARQTTTKLDSTMLSQIQSLTSSRRTIYVLQGHDELTVAGQKAGGPASFEQGRSLLERRLNLRVESLGLLEGGLNEVPDDAGAVLVLGPLRTPSTQQIAVLRRYLERGGALLLAHEPGYDVSVFEPLHERMLIRMDLTPLATQAQSLTLTKTRLDRYNIVTRDTVNHPATASFRDPREPLSLLFPSTGYLEETAAPDGFRKSFVEPLVGSPSSSWADLDGDYTYDPTTESRGRRILSLAVRPRPDTDQSAWRAIVMADSTVFSDLVLTRSQGNEALLLDHIAWLLEDTSSPGLPDDRGDRTLDLLGGPDRHLMLGLLASSPLLFMLIFGMLRRRRTIS